MSWRCEECDRELDVEDYVVERQCPFCFKILKTKEDEENGSDN